MSDYPSVIERSQDLSVQERAKGGKSSLMPLLLYMATGGNIVSPWWSPRRDIELRAFWKKSDHLSGAMYNFISKMTSIPFHVEPRDMSNKEHAQEADKLTAQILEGSEFGEGWATQYSKTVEDTISQDNGWFVEVIGEGDPSGPIIGRPITTAHLDASKCQRTGDPQYPILYNKSGRLYKLHFSRVMFGSQMPSPIEEMFGVGFCGVSRVISVAQTMIDILTYKQEKMGSRPHRQVIITQGGLDPEDVRNGFAVAEVMMNNSGLSRYSQIPVIGNASMTEADMKILELAGLPDGFDEETSTQLAMAIIAMGFGLDARELFPAMGSGATRADALLQHLKQRGKGPGQIIQGTESQFNQKFLPTYLKMVFDFQDDAEDQQVAEIKHVRSQRRERDLGDSAIDLHTAREQMVETGDLTRRQMEQLELADGRLDDGVPVTTLFYSPDKALQKLLAIPEVSDPLDTTENDPQYMKSAIAKQVGVVSKALGASAGETDRWNALKALSALEALRKLYEKDETPLPPAPQPGQEAPAGDGNAPNSRLFPTRRRNVLTPAKEEFSTQTDNRPSQNPLQAKEAGDDGTAPFPGS